MQFPDVINGGIEFLASFMVLNHCRVLIRDKAVAGVSILSTACFALWGGWNLFYYPHLDQWWSFAGGIGVMLANTLYIVLLLKYRTKKRNPKICR